MKNEKAMSQFIMVFNFETEPQIIEGFVFETDRFIVKLTGAFQSLNRICGTARYQLDQEFPEITD